MKNGLQRFGKFLSAMVMPNIGAFIAWGFITALFIADGWLPNERLASIQPYMLYYLIPVLIAGQGGYMVGGDRGRVMGAIAVMGTIAGVGGTEGQPMLLGAMVMGPLAGWCIKKFDQFMETRMPAGFEMLINNFSVGILGMLLAILGFYGIGPAMTAILAVLSAGVDVLVNHGLLPLAAIFIEPAKVLFLNNAINHGIFTPIGTEQALETGRSIMYMLEADPGPGLGVLLAYWAFAKDKATKQSVPGAVIIHFFGGIHEIYFPYVLMNPLVIIAPIVGNMVAIFWFSIMKCGLVSPAAPGSIIAFLSMTPKDKMWQTIVGVLLATVVSFLIASPIIKFTDKGKNLEDAQDQVAASKAQAKGAALTAGAGIADPSLVKKIIFACDAGMGSSAMGATKFRNRIKEMRPDITVTNTSVDNIPADCDIAVVQEMLIDRSWPTPHSMSSSRRSPLTRSPRSQSPWPWKLRPKRKQTLPQSRNPRSCTPAASCSSSRRSPKRRPSVLPVNSSSTKAASNRRMSKRCSTEKRSSLPIWAWASPSRTALRKPRRRSRRPVSRWSSSPKALTSAMKRPTSCSVLPVSAMSTST